jgi:protein-S-isoprenylcysteine O-methyltransferase Ste14
LAPDAEIHRKSRVADLAPKTLSRQETIMIRIAVLVGGGISYAAFLAAFLYLVGFLAGVGVPKNINSEQGTAIGAALFANSLLIGLFALQHAVMARDAFKHRWTRIVPDALERSLFVVAASLVLGLIFWQWRAIPIVVWDLPQLWLRVIVWSLFTAGIGIVLYTSFLIDHFDLFGLRQTWLYFRKCRYTHVPFSARSLYRTVRHPMMVGFLLMLWCVPTMTIGQLQFASLMTIYILAGVQMEERSLLRKLGAEYQQYHRRVPMLIPIPSNWRKAKPTDLLDEAMPEGTIK